VQEAQFAAGLKCDRNILKYMPHVECGHMTLAVGACNSTAGVVARK
jgi:hypothetical protein